ncbi:MAG: UDP-N-acetylmuramoyl-L-alanine--D-glutamate ligase, partial [Defluviitaleaceae bacterium]|nr:UDP-N-acetylmuramoyl-L-alanine--D-glutamate ligase [Defluviitaleaceae bacterium]
MDLFGKKALVCGMATSGISAAKLLRSKGAIVTLQDLKEEEKFDIDLNKIKSLGIDLFLGKNPDEIVGDFDLMVISPGLDLELSFIRKAMELGVEVIGEFELGARFCKAPILAITGTNGKTTTTA